VAIPLLTRRTVMGGAVAAVVGGVAGYLTVRSSGVAAGPAGASASGPTARAAAAPLIALGRLPAGGVVVLADTRIVLTRTPAGAVHGFSAVCTHQGCTVALAGGALACPCHGSRFAADTGAVTRGPATRPLPAVPVVVRNGEVFRS
jgi:Rieske Fe-S protein